MTQIEYHNWQIDLIIDTVDTWDTIYGDGELDKKIKKITGVKSTEWIEMPEEVWYRITTVTESATRRVERLLEKTDLVAESITTGYSKTRTL